MLYTSFHALFTGIVDLILIVKKEDFGILKTTSNIIVAWAIGIFAAMMWLLLFWFGLYHSCLICKNKTTNEEMRGKYKKYKGNPFDKGTNENCNNYCMFKNSRVMNY